MAYASVASLLQTLDILLDYHQPSISPQFKTQIISIHQHTSFMQSFIEGSSERVNNWEETIREVTNKAEDIIELLLSDSLLESAVGSSRSHELEKGKYEVCYYSLDELEKVREEMESIASRVKGGRRIETADGSDEEVMKIISQLRGGSAALEIIAISGIGGIGKTALAGDAYNHPLIVEHFDVRTGRTVNREVTWLALIVDLLRYMKAEKSGSVSEDELIERLSQIFGRRRYLIWLDDVWSLEVMERLKMMLPDYGNGSRIILTTRSFDLANFADHIHEMRLLDDDKTWNMLRQKIFKGDPCPFQLESTGKMIARSCGGHPLSIEVVSGILASDQTKAVWEEVSDNMKKILASEDGDKVYEIVYLSYIYLPHHLRLCLLYLGIFLEASRIYVSTLIKLWVAEGFLNESGSKSLEETCEGYVEDLLRRRLVLVSETKSNRRIKSIKVHNLVRGMCLRQAHIHNLYLHLDKVNCHTQQLEVKEIIKSCRRLSNLNDCDNFLGGVYGSTIRTLLFSSDYGKLDLRSWIGNIRLLRILSLSNVNNYHLSGEVFELFHLRYLAFYCQPNIPEAISNLQNLQTLIIRHSKNGGIFDKLPDGIWRMPQLRHFRIFSFKFPNDKVATSSLENLQTLSRTVDFVCSREILKMISNLKKLDLVYTKKLRYVVEDYELHNLIFLHKLEILKLGIMELSFEKEHKMSGVTFPLTLKKLSLSRLQLSGEDMKMVASLPNLEVLQLRNYACAGDTWETSEGGFSQLISLRIEESNLKNWITKSSHFPRLWRLVLRGCLTLLEVPYEMVEIRTLYLIYLDKTNHSLLRSAQRIQKDRHSFGHDPLHVDVQ